MFWAAGAAAATAVAHLASKESPLFNVSRYKATERYTLGWGDPRVDGHTLEQHEALRKLREIPSIIDDYPGWKRHFDWLGVRNRVLDKERNMKTRLDRRRDAIQAKWRARIKWTVCITFGIPITIGLLVVVWRLALYAVVS